MNNELKAMRGSRLSSCRAFRPRFTIIELLVVIVIITILASLLLPALSRARDAGRSIECVSNLKQLQLAHISYADDHDGVYIPNIMFPGYAWINTGLGNGYGLNKGHYIGGQYPEVALCPSNPLDFDAASVPTLYTINTRLHAGSPNHPNPLVAKPVVRMRQLKWPERTISVADAGDAKGTKIDFQSSYICTASFTVFRMGFWHPGQKANFSLADGHVASDLVRNIRQEGANYYRFYSGYTYAYK